MKKTFSVLLAIVMLFALCVTAYAENNNGSITIDNAVNGEEYNAYKIFDLTYDNDNVTYTYTASGSSDAFLTALSDAASPFNAVRIGTTAYVYSITMKTGVADNAVINWLKDHITNVSESNKLAKQTGANNKVKWENVAYGYYYVTSSLGSAVTVDSAKKDVTIEDKNSPVTVTKEQSATNGSAYADTDLSVSIGDTVYYEVIVTDGKSTDKAITLTDTMSDGLTNNKDYALYKNTVADENKLSVGTGYTLDEESDHGFKITVLADYVTTLNENDKIILRYSAKVNDKAVTKAETGDNRNTVTLKYSNQTITDSVDVTTCKIQIVKYNAKDKTFLDGAKFRIYDAATGGNEIKVVADGNNNYRVDTSAGASGVDIIAGKPFIKGLAEGKYYLQEIEAPKGFNPLTSRQEFVVNGDNLATVTETAYTSGGVGVANSAGSSLPTTGGMGTTLLFIIGSFAVLTTGVFLVANKRMKKEML